MILNCAPSFPGCSVFLAMVANFLATCSIFCPDLALIVRSVHLKRCLRKTSSVLANFCFS